MKRDEQIRAQAEASCYTKLQEQGFILGAHWADSHPHWEAIVKRLQEEITADKRKDRWISVNDELPGHSEENPNISVPVITLCYYNESIKSFFLELNRYHFVDCRWLYGQAAYWLPFNYPDD